MQRRELAAAIYRLSHLRGTFTLRSGAVASEYFDKYLFEADAALLRALGDHLYALLPRPVDALAGLEMGGIPLAVQLGQVTGLPTRFVRREAKAYGTCRLAEGGLIAGQHLVVVEDVVTSGGQIREHQQKGGGKQGKRATSPFSGSALISI